MASDQLAAEFVVACRPRDVVRAAGRYLANKLDDTGFAWLERTTTLARKWNGLLQEVPLQPSSLNRATGTITAQTLLNLREPALAMWRRTNRDRCVTSGDMICAHFLGYVSGRANGYVYGDFDDGELDLTDPAARIRHLDEFVAMFRIAVLPWFAEASDPDVAVSAPVADRTNVPAALAEWFASRGRPDLVRAYVDRYRARRPATAEAIAVGAAIAATGQPLSVEHGGNLAVELGWVSVMLIR
ncbi:hypothetical protein ABZS66_28935 [Dactylosporangium sp. NPDC005572]|uniref:hypothetical protein n=1 Tax=Dactylosporangium sp. NPDC005572 TaxID=3156889 RepID=UPI0033B694B3